MITSVHRREADVNLRHGLQMREYEVIADRIAADAPGRVLDWGCGFGQVSALLAARGIDVASFDYRPEEDRDGVRPLQRFPHLSAYISTSDPVGLPYDEDSFVAVLSCGVLEHVSDPDASLDELQRVLRPGGRLYVYKLPNRTSYLEWLAKRVGLYYHGSLPDDRLYDPASARSLLTRHGFQVDELRLANMLPLTVGGPLRPRLADGLWTLNRGLAQVPWLQRLATNVELVATVGPTLAPAGSSPVSHSRSAPS